jgi:hypothetical protein
LETLIPQTQYRVWTLENFDIKPPDSVICAEFERMQIQFNFLTIQEKAKRVKRVKSDAAQFDTGQELMLLDLAPGSGGHGSMNELACAVEEMQGLSGLIERYFDSRLGHKDQPAPFPQPWVFTFDENRDSHGSSLVRDAVEHDTSTANKRSKHSSEAIEILNGWLQAHASNPYPSNAEKLELIEGTGLKRCESDSSPCLLMDFVNLYLAQINAWFYTQRCRLRKDPTVTEDEVMLEQIDEGATSLAQVENHEDDDMLLSQATNNTPSLTSRSSVSSSILSTHNNASLKRPSLSDEPLSLDKFPACELGEAAIHILISGYIGRGLRGLGGVQVEKPLPSLSMARIGRATFCPGFKEVCVTSTSNL